MIGIHVPLCYIDINEGNHRDATMFAQLMRLYEPTSDGQPQPILIKSDDDEQYWLHCTYKDWLREIRQRKLIAHKCLSKLQARCLIVIKISDAHDDEVIYIRVNWDEFERRMKLWFAHQDLVESEKTFPQFVELLNASKPNGGNE